MIERKTPCLALVKAEPVEPEHEQAQPVAAGEPPAAVDAPAPGAPLAFSAPLQEPANLADRKAMFVVGAGGLMFTTLGAFSQSLWVMANARGPWVAVPLLAAVVCLAALILLAARCAYAAYVLPLPAMPSASLAFFRDVAGRGFREYADGVRGLTHAAVLRDVLH